MYHEIHFVSYQRNKLKVKTSLYVELHFLCIWLWSKLKVEWCKYMIYPSALKKKKFKLTIMNKLF